MFRLAFSRKSDVSYPATKAERLPLYFMRAVLLLSTRKKHLPISVGQIRTGPIRLNFFGIIARFFPPFASDFLSSRCIPFHVSQRDRMIRFLLRESRS